MDDSGIQTRFLTAVTHHTYVSYKTPTILQTILRVMRKIRKKKKTPTAVLNIFLHIFFLRKN